jgi:uncharacterized NAD-dependent epimerase/dehydratase family protein
MDLRSKYDAPVSAIVLAEGAFGTPDGKTANGVVIHSELFDTQAVVDSTHAGSNANEVLSNSSVSGVPVVRSMTEALKTAPHAEVLVIGVAPAGGALPEPWKADIQEAMEGGCDIVSGLHYFLEEDPEWRGLAKRCGVDLIDVRRPPDRSDLQVAKQTEASRETDVVLVMGTDCASGKRTTTVELYRQAKRDGLDAVWVATGQTGIMTGAHQGVVIDSVPADFTAGVVEQMVAELDEHDVVFVEGQAALTHRVYGGVTLSILGGAWPDAVIIADDPDRESREHFESLSVASVGREASLVEELSDAQVVAISTWGDPAAVEYELDVPVANVYREGGPKQLLDSVLTMTESRQEAE